MTMKILKHECPVCPHDLAIHDGIGCTEPAADGLVCQCPVAMEMPSSTPSHGLNWGKDWNKEDHSDNR